MNSYFTSKGFLQLALSLLLLLAATPLSLYAAENGNAPGLEGISQIKEVLGDMHGETLESLRDASPPAGMMPPPPSRRLEEIIDKALSGESASGLKEEEQREYPPETGVADVTGQAGIKEEEEKPSIIERFIAGRASREVSVDISQFGYDLFKYPAVVLKPEADLPIPDDYVIGPGDEINIAVWGRVNRSYNLTVNREGSINFPNIGVLDVAGLTLSELRKFLRHEIETKLVGSQAGISLGGLRSIIVYIVGDVKRAGAYTVSAYARITHALAAAGGPAKTGTLRKICLKRNGELAGTLDMYDFLLNGDSSGNVRLLAGDVIFVPPIGKIVGIAGNLKRPAIYELKGDLTVNGATEMAGGILFAGDTQRVQVERYQDHERKIILDLDMNDLEESGTILEDGDLIKVFSVATKEVNAVFLKGNVARPGKYQIKPGMMLSDLLSDTDDVLPDTCFEYAVIERLEPPEMSPRIIPFNPGNLLLNDDKDEDLALRAGDTIVVYDKWRFKSRPAIDIEGQVRNPGKFNLMDDMRVRDLILAAGGLTGDAYMELGEIYSTDGKTNKITVRTFNPGKALDEGLNDDLLLKDLDRVVIHSILEFEPDRTILVNGAVNQPGEYPFAANMTLKDAIFAAGNLLESAYMDEAEIIRKRVEDGRLVVSDKVSVDLRKVLSGDKDHNLPLRPYDAIFIKNIPEWSTYRFATIKGEVKFPGKYLIARGDRISSLLERTGNLTEDAYLKGGVFTRLSSRERQRKSIDTILEGLEKDVLRVGSGLEALTETETEATLLSLKTKSILIEKLKKIKPSGRVIVYLRPLPEFAQSEYDLILEDGDELYIPARPSTISVVGQVFNPSDIVYQEALKVSDYLDITGGTTRDADEDFITVIKADGTVVRTTGLFSNVYSMRLDPGDSIVVPEKLVRYSGYEVFKDSVDMMYKVAISLAALAFVF